MKAQQLLIPDSKHKTIFFAGKGGVGKTAVSCITALWLAEKRYKTLLISTDPASHLSEVLGQKVGSSIAAMKDIPNLYAVRIDQKKAGEEYKRRMLEEAGQRYSEEVVKVMKEQLDSPCSEELAAFDKFIDYMRLNTYDVVIFDTAPTGHTLRLLLLPVDWSRQLELSAVATAQVDVASAEVKEKYQQVIDLMKDPEKTVFAFVTYPEYTPIIEAYRASEEMGKVGVKTSLVVANYLLDEKYCVNDYFRKRKEMQDRYVRMMREKFNAPIIKMPLMESEIMGIPMLRKTGKILYEQEVIA